MFKSMNQELGHTSMYVRLNILWVIYFCLETILVHSPLYKYFPQQIKSSSLSCHYNVVNNCDVIIWLSIKDIWLVLFSHIHVLLHSVEVLPLFILQLKFFFHYFCCIHDSLGNWTLRVRNPCSEVISMYMPICKHVTGFSNRDSLRDTITDITYPTNSFYT